MVPRRGRAGWRRGRGDDHLAKAAAEGWPAMFERFTDRARRVVVLAQEEARLLNHGFIGTEHLLLGLLREEEGVAARALASLHVELEAVRASVTEKVGPARRPSSGHIPFTPRAKRVLELSLREALQLGHNYIGTEHLLLGLIREGEGVAAQVLTELGADLNRVRQRVIGMLRDASPVRQPRQEGSASSQPRPRGASPRPGESELASGFGAQLAAIETRLSSLEHRVGVGPDVSDLDGAIARTLGEKHAAADAQDYEQAAVLRDTERRLRAEMEARRRRWTAAHPDLATLAESVQQLAEQVRRLLDPHGEHGIEEPAEHEPGAPGDDGQDRDGQDGDAQAGDRPADDQPGAGQADGAG